jgi:hypothetical protein
MPTIAENQKSAKKYNITSRFLCCRNWEEREFKGYTIQFSRAMTVSDDEDTGGVDDSNSETEFSVTTSSTATPVSYDSDDSDLEFLGFLRSGCRSDGTRSFPRSSQNAPLDASQAERFGPSPNQRPIKRAASDPQLSHRRETASQAPQPANTRGGNVGEGNGVSSQFIELADLGGNNVPQEPRQPEVQPQPEPEPAPESESEPEPESDPVCCDCCGGWCLRCSRVIYQNVSHLADVFCCWLNCLTLLNA